MELILPQNTINSFLLLFYSPSNFWISRAHKPLGSCIWTGPRCEDRRPNFSFRKSQVHKINRNIMVLKDLWRRLRQKAFVVLLILLAGAYFTSIKSTPILNQLWHPNISLWRSGDSGEQGDTHSMIYIGQHEIFCLPLFCFDLNSEKIRQFKLWHH